MQADKEGKERKMFVSLKRKEKKKKKEKIECASLSSSEWAAKCWVGDEGGMGSLVKSVVLT